MHEITLSEAISRWFNGNKHMFLLMARKSGKNTLVRQFKWYIRAWKFILKIDKSNRELLDETGRKMIEEARRMVPHDTGYLRGRILARFEDGRHGQ